MLTGANTKPTEYRDAGATEALPDAEALQPLGSPAPAVTMLCWLYAPFPGGGADRVMQQVAEFLVRGGWRVSVFTKTLKGLPKRETIQGVAVQRVFTLELPLVRYASFMTSAFVRQVFRRDPGQVLHANQFHLQVPLSLLASRLRRTCVVIGVHGSGRGGDMQRLGRLPLGVGRLVLWAGRRTDAVISLTTQMSEELLAAGIPADRVVLIPNGVDCTLFAPVSPERRAELRAQFNLPLIARSSYFPGGWRFPRQSMCCCVPGSACTSAIPRRCWCWPGRARSKRRWKR